MYNVHVVRIVASRLASIKYRTFSLAWVALLFLILHTSASSNISFGQTIGVRIVQLFAVVCFKQQQCSNMFLSSRQMVLGCSEPASSSQT